MESPKTCSLRKRLFAPVDIAFLVFFRLGFAGSCFGRCIATLAWVELSRTTSKKVFASVTTALNGSEPWPGDGMYWHFYAMGAFAACILVGFCYQAAAFLLPVHSPCVPAGPGILPQSLLSGLPDFVSHGVVPAHRAWSVDAWLRQLASLADGSRVVAVAFA